MAVTPKLCREISVGDELAIVPKGNGSAGSWAKWEGSGEAQGLSKSSGGCSGQHATKQSVLNKVKRAIDRNWALGQPLTV